jgi:hypothetical protein
MTSADFDPHAAVTEPVRHALGWLVVRGVLSFAVAVTAVVVNVAAADGPLHLIGHVALPVVLGSVVLARIVHVALDREPWDGYDAWSRAAAVDRAETMMVALVAVVVPLGWIVGLGAILVHHLSQPAQLAEVLGVWAPAAGGLWAAATISWAGDCRERLARAVAESSRRFRAYWAGLRRSA